MLRDLKPFKPTDGWERGSKIDGHVLTSDLLWAVVSTVPGGDPVFTCFHVERRLAARVAERANRFEDGRRVWSVKRVEAGVWVPVDVVFGLPVDLSGRVDLL